MNKKSVITVLIAVLVLAAAGAAQAAPYFIYCKVFSPDGTSGTAATENSQSSLSAFRAGIPGEIGKQNAGPDGSYPEKVYPSFYNSINTPAYAYTDVGSSDWATVPAAGQTVISVMQVFAPQFGWSGGSYMACTLAVISDNDVVNSETDLSPVALKQIPAPVLMGSGPDYIDLSWTGIDMDLVTGYTVYRSDNPSGVYAAVSYTAAQNRNGPVAFTDATVAQGSCYYYKIAINVEWGGGNGAPDYFVTGARSEASLLMCAASTPTITPTQPSPSVTPTRTETNTDTPTMTYTATGTTTQTNTDTSTPTGTFTCTPTPTGSATGTPTFTHTPSATSSATAVNTATPTVTATSALAANLDREKLVILNIPITDGRLQIGLYSAEAGTVTIYVYNISGELVLKTAAGIYEGANVINEEFKKARGVYILRAVIKTQSGTEKPPLRKFVVIKNIY